MADSITTRTLIARVRNMLHEKLPEFFLAATTSAAGTTTTFKISSSIGNDYFNDEGMEVAIIDGNNAGLRGEIVDWITGSPGTGTVLSAFPFAIDTNVQIQIGPRGFFSDQDFPAWFMAAADYVFRRIMPDKLTEYLTAFAVSGTPVYGQPYGTAAMPADRIGNPTKVWIDNRIATKLGEDETEVFQSGVMIDRAWVMKDSANINFKPRPETSAEIKFQYIPRPQTFSLNTTVDWPRKTYQAILNYVAAKGFEKRERADLVDMYMKLAEGEIAGINTATE